MLVSQDNLQEVIDALKKEKTLIAVDTETNITERYHERFLLGISIATEHHTFYIPVGHESFMGEDVENVSVPLDLFKDLEAPIGYFNAKFDIEVLLNAGFELPRRTIWDAMLMCHHINENEFQFSLDAMSKKYLGKESVKEKELAKAAKKFGWSCVPPYIMDKYASMDAVLTRDLVLKLMPMFDLYQEAYRYDMQFLWLLVDLERKGVRVNLDKVVDLQEQCYTRLEELKKQIGFDPAKTKLLQERLFSEPPVGYGLKVLEKTPGGKPKVSDKFLEVTNHPVCGLIREYRQINKQLTSYYNSYERLCSGYGRLHPSFKQHGTVTGRLSCADPNMQQIPRDSPIKSLFLPEDGFQLWEIDFKNIEMRLAAVYSQESSLLETFREEGDVHQLTADLLGISRQHAKTVNFLIIYGGGAKALSQQINLSESECRKILDRFRQAYPRLFATMNAATAATESNGGWVKMWSGRRRHFMWSNEYHKAFNSIVQGGAFEIVKRSMLLLQEQGFDMRNQVHDSVWLNVKSQDEVLAAEKIMSEWTTEDFGLTFSVESKRLA